MGSFLGFLWYQKEISSWVTIFVENLYYSSNPILKIYADLAENLRKIWNSLIYLMANFEDFLSNFPYLPVILPLLTKIAVRGHQWTKEIVTHGYSYHFPLFDLRIYHNLSFSDFDIRWFVVVLTSGVSCYACLSVSADRFSARPLTHAQ